MSTLAPAWPGFRPRNYTAHVPGNSWWDFLDAQLADHGWSPADLARAAGVSHGRIVDWRDAGATPSIKNARAVAHALGVPLLAALVAASILTPDEAYPDQRPTLDDCTTLELLRELENRFDEVHESRQRLAGGLVDSATPDRQRAQTRALFVEAEQVVRERHSRHGRLRHVSGESRSGGIER